MMVADKMSNRPNRPNRLIGPIRLIISHLSRKQKNATPGGSRIFCSLVRRLLVDTNRTTSNSSTACTNGNS